MTAFDILDQMAGQAVLSIYGESFTVTPRTAAADVNARLKADTSRPAFSFMASLHEYFSRADMQDGGSARSLTATTAANLATPAGHTTARIRIKFRAYDLPHLLKKGDKVRRDKTGDEFRVAELRMSHLGNVTADLNLLVQAAS